MNFKNILIVFTSIFTIQIWAMEPEEQRRREQDAEENRNFMQEL